MTGEPPHPAVERPDRAEPPDRGKPPVRVAPVHRVEEPERTWLELREGLGVLVDTPEALAAAARAFAAGTGPVAVDAERASGYRYSARAYLVQLRREGSGTALVDPMPFDDLDELGNALSGAEWILHAASQDLPCLAELGMTPDSLFDTELAGRLLGYPRVGLGTLVEEVLGKGMRKEHAAVDWSRRPLPEPWLEYAALDVEALIELRDVLSAELEAAGKREWARQEFAHLRQAAPNAPRQDPWRRTSGLHRARGRRALAAVRALWECRDEIARQRDVTPGWIIPDSAIVAAANALPRDRSALLAVNGFHGRGAERYATRWLEALHEARALPDDQLPPVAARYDGPPPPRAWVDRNQQAAERLTRSRTDLKELAEKLVLPVENLLTPDHLRRLMWQPPQDGAGLPNAVADKLRALGAREWQIELSLPVLVAAIRDTGS
jgi:ribonuclease D